MSFIRRWFNDEVNEHYICKAIREHHERQRAALRGPKLPVVEIVDEEAKEARRLHDEMDVDPDKFSDAELYKYNKYAWEKRKEDCLYQMRMREEAHKKRIIQEEKDLELNYKKNVLDKLDTIISILEVKCNVSLLEEKCDVSLHYEDGTSVT